MVLHRALGEGSREAELVQALVQVLVLVLGQGQAYGHDHM